MDWVGAFGIKIFLVLQQIVFCYGQTEFILVADYNSSIIYRIDKENGSVLSSFTTTFPNGVLYDYTTDTILVASTKKYIKRFNVDGSGEITVYNTSKHGAFPDRIAMDFSTGTIYYTANYINGNSAFIASVTKDGAHTVLIENLHFPRDIILHPNQNMMFWTDWGLQHIGRAKLDGSDKTFIITTGVIWPNGLALDFQENKLYWTDGHLNKIERCSFSGDDRDVIIANTGRLIMDIDIAGDYIFYTKWHHPDGLHRFAKNNPDDNEPFSSLSLVRTDSIFVYSEWLLTYPGQSSTTTGAVCSQNPCHNGGSCEDTDSGEYRCYCTQGWTGVHCEIHVGAVAAIIMAVLGIVCAILLYLWCRIKKKLRIANNSPGQGGVIPSAPLPPPYRELYPDPSKTPNREASLPQGKNPLPGDRRNNAAAQQQVGVSVINLDVQFSSDAESTINRNRPDTGRTRNTCSKF